MPDYGFGHRPFGENTFGIADWSRIVLWDEMPENIRLDDQEAGYPYKKFVEAMCPSFTWLQHYIKRFRNITDPIKIRTDLLSYLGESFGIIIDESEPEAYRRMRASLAARWLIIKGTIDSYVVLCRVHGFEVEVVPLWWNGTNYFEDGPTIYNEASSYTATENGGNTEFVIRYNCYPMEPNSLTVVIPQGASSVTLTDNGDGIFTGYPSSRVDYGWGYSEVILSGTGYGAPASEYDSVVGGCAALCNKCKTHRLRLKITAGTISGQSDLTITEAFKRLYDKLGLISQDGVIPIHVELEQTTYETSAVVSIGHRYDVLEGDVSEVDGGLRWGVV